MTIRTRLTFWYVSIMFASLLAMVGFSYHEFVVEPARHARQRFWRDRREDFLEDRGVEVINIVLGCGLPAAALALAGGWWLMRKALKPVTAITAAAEQITERNLRERLPRTGNGDEFDRLTQVFNDMTARLDNSFQRIREFTLHASHELKTPLTVLHGELETQLQQPDLSESRRESLLSELDEVQRLSKIVDGLTLLTKADAGQVSLNFEPVQLDELVRDALADAQILAKPGAIQVHLGLCNQVTVRGDRHRLRQLLLNLTDNAIKYNKPGGLVNIELTHLPGGVARLMIANTGDGIPPDKLSRVFERFFRGDASHNSAIDGCGLGLSICKWIVSAHQGTIKLTSIPNDFTKVVVTLPTRQQSETS